MQCVDPSLAVDGDKNGALSECPLRRTSPLCAARTAFTGARNSNRALHVRTAALKQLSIVWLRQVVVAKVSLERASGMGVRYEKCMAVRYSIRPVFHSSGVSCESGLLATLVNTQRCRQFRTGGVLYTGRLPPEMSYLNAKLGLSIYQGKRAVRSTRVGNLELLDKQASSSMLKPREALALCRYAPSAAPAHCTRQAPAWLPTDSRCGWVDRS